MSLCVSSFVPVLCEPESVPPSMLSCKFTPVPVSVSVYLSFTESFCSVFTEQHRKLQVGGMRGTLQKSQTDFYKGLSLCSRDPDNKQVSTIKHMLYPRFMANIHFIRTTWPYIMFSSNVCIITYIKHMCLTLGQGHGRVHNLRLQLCTSLGCKRAHLLPHHTVYQELTTRSKKF